MPLAREYTVHEVRNILQASEGTASPVTGQPGHAILTHLNRVNVGSRPHLATDTAYIAHHADQAWAVTQALNSPEGQRELAALDAGSNRRKINAPTVFPMIQAAHRVSHNEVVQPNQLINAATVVVDRDPLNPNTPHIQTAYPT